MATTNPHEGPLGSTDPLPTPAATVPESATQRLVDPLGANGPFDRLAPLSHREVPTRLPLFQRARRARAAAPAAVSPSSASVAAPVTNRGARRTKTHPGVEPASLLDERSQALIDLRRRERIFRRLLGAADAFTATVAVTIALDGLGTRPVRPLFALVAPGIVLAAKAAGLYDKDELVIDHSTLNELPRLANLATMFTLIVWLGRHYLVGAEPRTVNLLELWLLLTGGLVASRSLVRQLAARIAPVERCLLVGRSSVFDRLERRFAGFRGASLVGQLTPTELANDPDRLRQIVERNEIHRVIIDTDATSAAATLDAVRLANAAGLQVSLLPTILGAVGGSVVFDDIGGLVLMGVPRFGLSRSSLALKRAFDLLGAAVILIALAPLFALIVVAIKLDSRGPALFRQTRVGRNDKPFEMAKFRTMIDGADALKESLRQHNEADGLFKIHHDPRITGVGHVLRRTGLDELPQLLNVLGGSMSLVGPRPLVSDEDQTVTGFDRHRLHLTPGITGRWQTLGAARVPLSEMVKIDYLYIANWSPWTDVRIIIETVGYLARRNGQ